MAVSSMKTETPDPRLFPRYAGVCSFFRFPLETKVKPVDWALYGVPFDAGTTYRPGARFGPRGIREQSAYIKPYHLVYGQNLKERYSMVDAGDSPVHPFSLEETRKMHFEFAKQWRAAGAKTFAVGGDHSISLGNMQASFESVGEKLALIHFDSHTDTVDELWGSKISHASPVIRGIEAGYFEPGMCLSFGIKGPVNSDKELDWGKKNGVELVTFDQWRAQGLKPLEAFRKKIGNRPVYFTFDIDCVDPVFAPGTGTPSVGGFSSAEVIECVRAFRGVNLTGADLVEVAPALDPSYVTSLLGAQIIFEILSL